MDPTSFGIVGSTQPEMFQGTVDAMVQELRRDADQFWQTAVQDGPIEIWEICGERFLFNGNHRYHAAIQARVEIPVGVVRIVERTGSTIPTFRFQDLIWLPGRK